MIYRPSVYINEEAIFSKSKKNPIFIVLSSGHSLFASLIKKATHSEISHAMISFNSKLDPLYSFGTRPDGHLGFVINNTKARVWDKEDCKYSVYVMYVTDNAKKAMTDRLQYFVDNEKNLKYSFKGVLDIFRGKESENDEKWFCSRFVMELISKAQTLPKVPSLWKPSDINSLENISLVNRGFNLYNYNYKVTERHCKNIKDGTYDPGDVIYEDARDEYIKYLTGGSEYYLEKEYDERYKPYHYKIPEVGFPTNKRDEYLAVEAAAKKAARKYYTFKPADANRNYPFKFFEILNIDKAHYMKLINGNVPAMKRFDANLYHVNIRDDNRRISVILVARPGEIFAMYFLLPNGDALYRFNYEGLMFQEQSKFHELSSSVEKDFSSKKDYNLSAYTRVRLTDAIVQVYRFSKPSLDNIKINKDTKGYIWLDDKEVVGYINVEERDDDYKWIQSFEIYEPYKGHGLSKQILKIAITELGATNLTVSKDNDLAIKVYKSFGFKTYKSTDSSYNMSRDKNIEEAYYSKDPFTNAQSRSSLNDSDFRDTAAFAQKQLAKLHSAGQYNFITCTDIGFSEGELSYAEYEIENDYQIEQLRKLINILNKTVSTSKYCGTFLFPQQISVGAVGSLKLKMDDRYVSEEAIKEKQVKSYKNPAMQLRIKNTKKKNDQISKGNYIEIPNPKPPKSDNNKKS